MESHWIIFGAIILIMMVLDLGVFNKTAHSVTTREAGFWTVAWVVLALVFNGYIYYDMGEKSAIDFFTGYLVEKSLSIDNVFVFLTLFTSFKVPSQYQHRVLFWGVIGAIIMRGIFIAIGAALIEQFEWIFYIFGAFLLFTAYKIWTDDGHQLDFAEMPLIRFCKKHLPMTSTYHDHRFFVKIDHKWYFTPLFLVLLAIELSDVVFAVDSVPAIFAITRDPFIVYTSNIFAIFGLRNMYFLLANAAIKIRYLSIGLASILGFIAFKMLCFQLIHIPGPLSLMIIVTILLVTVGASLYHKNLTSEKK